MVLVFIFKQYGTFEKYESMIFDLFLKISEL